jgi:hypothetical protein
MCIGDLPYETRLTPLEFLLSQFSAVGATIVNVKCYVKSSLVAFHRSNHIQETCAVTPWLHVICKYDSRMISRDLRGDGLDVVLSVMKRINVAEDVCLWKRVWKDVPLPEQHWIYQHVFARYDHVHHLVYNYVPHELATIVNDYT